MISVFSLKGGQGKTTISFSLSMDIKDCMYISNDKINSLLPTKIHPRNIDSLTTDIIKNNEVVFDCGGFIDKEITEVIRYSKIVIVPLEYSSLSILSVKQFLPELRNLNKNIIFVINKWETEDKFKTVKKQLVEKFGVDKDKIFRLKKSNVFEDLFEHKMGLKEYVNQNNTLKYRHRNILKDYDKILKYIKEL